MKIIKCKNYDKLYKKSWEEESFYLDDIARGDPNPEFSERHSFYMGEAGREFNNGHPLRALDFVEKAEKFIYDEESKNEVENAKKTIYEKSRLDDEGPQNDNHINYNSSSKGIDFIDKDNL